MGKINGCLKCVFISFNLLFAILGGLLIYGLISTSGSQQEQLPADVPGLVWGWVFAISVFGISCLGIFAACSEKLVALRVFASFMGIGMVIMIYGGINVVKTRTEIMSYLQSSSSDLVDLLMKESHMTLEELQQFLKCCGRSSAHSWGNQIPDSCDCSSSNPGYGGYGGVLEAECKSRPEGTTGPEKIYTESCNDVVLWLINFFFNIMLGFLFGFAVLALLGLIITVFMIHQVKRNDADEYVYMKSY